MRENFIRHNGRRFILAHLWGMDEKLQAMYLRQTWVQRYLRRYCKEGQEGE